MKKILVTGAGGFIGQRFIVYNKNKYQIQPLSLRDNSWETTADISSFHSILHLAGKAHEMQKIDEHIYFDINLTLTQKLINKAIEQNVKQFIYVSSTKVYGDTVKEIITENSSYNPSDAYGRSKMETEKYILEKSDQIKVAIVRPPLVYGPNVKGNLNTLVKLCRKNIPLPLAKTNNLRSMIFIDNLIALFNTIIDQQESGIFLASDKNPITTSDLIKAIKKEMDLSPKLFSIPLFIRPVIKFLYPSLHTRLFGSYIINSTLTNQKLNFTPPYSFNEGIKSVVENCKQ